MLLKVFVQKNCLICEEVKKSLEPFLDNKNIKIIEAIKENKEEFEMYKVIKTPVRILVDDDNVEVGRFYGKDSLDELMEML